MKQQIILLLVLMSCFVNEVTAQRYVLIEASNDPMIPMDIYPIIMGDTTSSGDRVDNNTIYQLENGQVYITTERLVNKPEWPLKIESQDLSNLEEKPVITRIPNNTGVRPSILYPEGDVSLTNLWIISGERGPLETPQWGTIRLLGTNARVRVKDCIIEKDNGGFLQIRANGIRLYIERCIFRNGGNRRILQGNGRGVDARNFFLDTLVMKNSIVHNIHDRLFRSQGGLEPHKYIEIDHCTSFNTTGRHGHIQLGRVLEARITNNLFIDPIMMGTSPIYTDEQNQPDNDQHKVITIDTLYSNTMLTISNNNIFWHDEVIDYWNSNDTVFAPPVLSDLISQNLGSAVNDAYYQEQLNLNNVPVSMLPYVIDLYNDPTASDMFDIIVEDSLLVGTSFDSGNLFDFSEFDPCYSPDLESATADNEGNAVGAVAGCADLTTSIIETSIFTKNSVHVFPNPASESMTVQIELLKGSPVELIISDVLGKTIEARSIAFLQVGQHNFNWEIPPNIPAGTYFIQVRTRQGATVEKVVVR